MVELLVVVTLGPGKMATLALAQALEMVPTFKCLLSEEIQAHVYNGVPDLFPPLSLYAVSRGTLVEIDAGFLIVWEIVLVIGTGYTDIGMPSQDLIIMTVISTAILRFLFL